MNVAKIFLLLSGENPTLPFSEAQSILDAEGCSYKVVEKLPQVLRIESSFDCVTPLISRASTTRMCGLELFTCKSELNEILMNAQSVDLGDTIERGESFVVRLKRLRGSAPQIGRWDLEQKIGGTLFSRTKDVKVDLKNPQKTFVGVFTGTSFVFGLKLAEVRSKSFVERRPRKRAFFHPTAMPAKLARCMVNLAQPRRDELLLDPFCGTGTFLVEAGLIGCRVLGFDADRRMVEGSLRNLSRYRVEPYGMLVADARCSPLLDSSIDCIVTDPPYGLSATTLGSRPVDVIEAFLSNIVHKMRKGRRICIAAPKDVGISELAERLGFKHLGSHLVYVHRRLTREIAILTRD